MRTPARPTLTDRLRLRSLRTRLGAAALAALVTAVMLGSLLWITAGAAREVVQTADELHSRVQVYSMLIAAARTFQNASYADAHYRTPQTMEELETARSRFVGALAGAQALPQENDAQRALAARLKTQGDAVTEHLATAMHIVARIDEVWRTEGRHAAGIEAERSALPVRALQSTLDEEIRRGDEQIAAASRRAMALSRGTLVACVIGLALAVATWALMHGLLLRRISPGLRRLEQGTRAFAAGDLSHRTQLGGRDELTEISSALDSMATKLDEKQQALQQIHLGLETAVRERTQQLEHANRELSASDGRRRAFLADIGHELRTPLTIIRGEAQVALRAMGQPDFNAGEALERIIDHTHDLSRMVEDLFLIARAEAGGLPMNLRLVDLRELTERVAGDFEALAGSSGATIGAVAGPPVFHRVDPDRLRRALASLIDNALRHTRDDVTVSLEVRETGDTVEISVSDDGPGVDPALVPELFQRFRRGHTQGEGTGLGLSLARALVEAQSGRARLENRPEGGCRAVLEFPRDVHTQEAKAHGSAVG